MSLLTDTVHAWRSADGTHYLTWDLAASDTVVDVEVLTAEQPATVSRPPEEAAGTRACVAGLCPLTRHRFRVSDNRGNGITVSTRGMGFEGADNFRDFGGYPTRSGRTVGWGYFYRSGNLSVLSAADVDYLARLDIALICDFRREDEQVSDPSRLPLSGRR
ncbi:MAG: tyrosine-protein phosphatase, partial [Chromatocurvus sp.]